MTVSKRLRYEILRRDNHACRYCGASAPDVKLTVDHVVPVALGGTGGPSNLVAACMDCNAGKSASSPDAPLVDDVAADALRWSGAMTQAARITRRTLAERVSARTFFRDEIWGNWTYEYKGERRQFELSGDWENTIDRFLDAGIEEPELVEAVRIAITSRSRDPFRYMCGVAWNMVSERQQIAQQIVNAELAHDGS